MFYRMTGIYIKFVMLLYKKLHISTKGNKTSNCVVTNLFQNNFVPPFWFNCSAQLA